MTPKIEMSNMSSSLVLAPARVRETPPPKVSFRKVMEGGAQLLAAGARVATRIIGGPFLAAGMTGANSSLPGVGSSGVGGTSGTGGIQDPLQSLQNQRMSDDLKLLALQDQIQRDNRQIALVSNVMKARHDTAKSAISNIRS